MYRNKEKLPCATKGTGIGISVLYILYQQEPTTDDGKFVQVWQWLTAEGDYSDLVVGQGLVQNDDLQTDTMFMPFHYTVDQALDSINGRIGE